MMKTDKVFLNNEMEKGDVIMSINKSQAHRLSKGLIEYIDASTNPHMKVSLGDGNSCNFSLPSLHYTVSVGNPTDDNDFIQRLSLIEKKERNRLYKEALAQAIAQIEQSRIEREAQAQHEREEQKQINQEEETKRRRHGRHRLG